MATVVKDRSSICEIDHQSPHFSVLLTMSPASYFQFKIVQVDLNDINIETMHSFANEIFCQ